MGCWNKTCGLSNLHITAGSQAYVFVLIEVPRSSDRCYTSAFWKPIMLNFVADYDDYGGAENCTFELEHVIQGVRRSLVEVKQGPNQYHDIAVSKSELDENLFFEAIREHRLKINDCIALEETPHVDFVMLRMDVVDKILREYKIEQLRFEAGSGESRYVYYGFWDLISTVPDLITRIKEAIKDNPDDSQGPALRKAMFSLNGLSGIFGSGFREHPVSGFLSQDVVANSVVRVDEIVVDLIDQGDDVLASQILTSYIRGNFIDSYMNSVRKIWMPAGHEGSQSCEIEPYRLLCDSITEALDREQAEQEEW